MTSLKSSDLCPCSHAVGTAYQQCCEPYHKGQAAPSAVALMRSRYSAYVLKLEAYLLGTWHPSTRPKAPLLNDSDKTRWQRLEIKESRTSDSQQEAWVEFVAVYKIDGKAHRLHENSYFVFENHRWYYVNGTFD